MDVQADGGEVNITIRIKTLEVSVYQTDEGVVVEIWPRNGEGESLGSTYALFSEGRDYDGN